MPYHTQFNHLNTGVFLTTPPQLLLHFANLNLIMQEQRVNPEVALKRQSLMRDIRNLSKESIKHRARSHMITLLSEEELMALIKSTELAIKPSQLDSLIKYANLQYPKAIAHLGNLILDEIINIQQLQRYHLKPGYHPYWLWLIEVLVEKEYCTLNLVQHCICSLSAVRSEQTVKRGLSILYKITSSILHSPLLLRDGKALMNVLNTALRNDSAADQGYLLIYQVVKKSSQEISSRLEGNFRSRFLQVLIHGSLKVDRKIKLLTLKILKQLIGKGVYFQQLSETIIQLMSHDWEQQSSELVLQYLTSFARLAQRQQLLKMLDEGLIIELGKLKKHFEENQLLLGAVIRLGRELDQRSASWGYLSRGVHRQLQKYHLLLYSHQLQFC